MNCPKKYEFIYANPPNLEKAASNLYRAAKMLENLMVNHSDEFQIITKDLTIDLKASIMLEQFRKAIIKAERK